MKKWAVKEVVGNWGQRKNVKNGEDDKVFQKCYDARNMGNIEIF